MSNDTQNTLDLVKKTGISNIRIIEAFATILAQETYPDIKIKMYSIKGDDILGFRFNMGGKFSLEDFVSTFREIKKSIENVMGIKRPIYTTDYEEYAKDGEFAHYFKEPAPIASTIVLMIKNRPDLIEKSFELIREDSFKEALCIYKIFGKPEYYAPYNLYQNLAYSVEICKKEWKDLDPESGKSNKEILQDLEEKYKNYYKDKAKLSFEVLKNKFPEHRDEKPEEYLVSAVAYYTHGMKAGNQFGINTEEAKKDFSILDPNGLKDSNEMAKEVDKAVAIWNMRSVYIKITTGYFTTASKKIIDDINNAKKFINTNLIKHKLDYTIFYEDKSITPDVAKNNFQEAFSDVEKKYINSAKREAKQILNELKNNFESSPDKYISKINEKLEKVNLKHSDVSKNFSQQIDFYKKLSHARIAYGILLEGKDDMDKKATSKFIMEIVKEIKLDYKSLAPKSTWTSEEIEKFLISSAYVNPALGSGRSKSETFNP